MAQVPGSKRPISDDDNMNPAEVPQAFEYYDIHNNGRKDYVIRPVVLGLPPWEELQQLKSIVHRVQYEVGDIVYIYLGNSDDDGIALIREIRDLGDGRAMICVLWYAAFEEAVTYKCRNLHLWPRGHTHMVTNQLAVLMWDTANGKVTGDALNHCVTTRFWTFVGLVARYIIGIIGLLLPQQPTDLVKSWNLDA
jgi:hypothetical protein